MRQAEWISCDEPPAGVKAGLVWLCEHVVATEDDLVGPVEYYVHSSEQIAFARTSSSWFFARTDRWTDPDRRSPHNDRRQPVSHIRQLADLSRPDNLREFDRRDRLVQDTALALFLERWGNGGS